MCEGVAIKNANNNYIHVHVHYVYMCIPKPVECGLIEKVRMINLYSYSNSLSQAATHLVQVWNEGSRRGIGKRVQLIDSIQPLRPVM